MRDPEMAVVARGPKKKVCMLVDEADLGGLDCFKGTPPDEED